MKKVLLLFTVISLAVFSCRKEKEILESSKNLNATTGLVKEGDNKTSSIVHENMVKLGVKLENPYTVENMLEAYTELIADSPEYTYEDLNIEASHYYIRFQPADSIEMRDLEEENTDIEFFYYPLDYQILEGGTYYHDPSIVDDEFTWMYTVVEKGYAIPNVNHEILADLYIPELLEEQSDPILSTDSNFVTLLVNYALERTGNLEKPDNAKIAGWFSSWFPVKWTPKGTIGVHDDIANTMIK